MSERTALVSIATLVVMDEVGDLMKHPVFLDIASPVDLESVIYSSLIQCGAERFELPYFEEQKPPDSEFLKARIKNIPEREPSNARRQIREMFAEILPENWWRDDKYAKVWRIQWFLDELLLCAERKISLASRYPVPDVGGLEELMPPELLIPIRNLWTTLEPYPASLPLPKAQVSHNNIRRFEQVIESDLFAAYSARHYDLEDANIPERVALEGVTEKGGQMLRSNVDLLALKKLTVSLLPVTARVIETMFGGVSGILSNYLATLLTDIMDQERRVVIYQLDSMYD